MVEKKIEQLGLLEILEEERLDKCETYWWAKGALDVLEDVRQKILEKAESKEKK